MKCFLIKTCTLFFQAKCYRKFDEFKEMGRTILFVSHDLGSISRYCDRVILLNKGVKLDEGNPKDMVDLYKKVLVHQENERPEGTTAVETEKKETKWKKPFEVNPNADEYGTKVAEIIDYIILDAKGLETNTIEKFSDFSIKMRVKFNQDIADPIYAFTLKNLQGTDITGTNTMFEKIAIAPQKKGNIQEITFTQNMNLQGGEYLLSLGCTGYHDGDFDVYHRLYDICNITVIAAKNTVGFYDMNSSIEVVDEKSSTEA